MKKIILTGLIAFLGAISFSNAYVIQGDDYAFVVLENGQNGDFVGTNFSTNNTNTLTNLGYGNWSLTNESGSYNNIREIRTINWNGGYMYYFWNNGMLIFQKSIGQNNGSTFVVTGYVKTDITNFLTDINTENYTEKIPIGTNVNTIIYGMTKTSNGQFSVRDNTYICFGNKQGYIYCASCYAGDSSVQASCKGGQVLINLGLTSNSRLIDITEGGKTTESPFNSSNTNFNEYSCPTVQQLINTYPSDYNTNLCYSSNLIYSGGTIHTVTPKSIFTLYPQLTDFTQDIATYNSYCNNASTTTACQTMFENKEEQYTLIAKIPNTVQTTKLYEYCNLSLNYEPTQTTCTTNTGTQIPISKTGININDIITEIGEGNYTVITPGRPPESIGTGNGSGSVYDGLTDSEDETERWNVVRNAKDIINTMKELYAKFTGIFRGRSGTQGVIPFYITGLILLIVLFKLFKK